MVLLRPPFKKLAGLQGKALWVGCHRSRWIEAEVLGQVASAGSALRSDRDHLRDSPTVKLSIIPLPSFPLHFPLGCGESSMKAMITLENHLGS